MFMLPLYSYYSSSSSFSPLFLFFLFSFLPFELLLSFLWGFIFFVLRFVFSSFPIFLSYLCCASSSCSCASFFFLAFLLLPSSTFRFRIPCCHTLVGHLPHVFLHLPSSFTFSLFFLLSLFFLFFSSSSFFFWNSLLFCICRLTISGQNGPTPS